MNKMRIIICIVCIIAILAITGCKKADVVTENSMGTESETTIAPTSYSDPDVGESDEEGIDNAETTVSMKATEEVSNETNTEETEETEETSEIPETTVPVINEGTSICCQYAAYLLMSPEEQQAYMESYDSMMDFITWAQQAEAEHTIHNDDIVVEGGDINIGDYINP